VRVKLIDAKSEEYGLQFSHFDHDAPAGLWKKENIIIRDCIKINVFVEGRFSVFSDGILHEPIYGDVCILAPQKMHYGQIPEQTHVNYYQLNVGRYAFDAIPDGRLLIERLLETVALRDAFIRPDPQNRELVLGLCGDIEEEIQKNEFSLAYAKIIELLFLFRRLYSASDLIPGVAFSYHTAQAIRYMERNYSEPITLERIANKTKVSASYLSRIFKRETGMGLHEYLNQYRILRATSLLETHSVTETAYLCGFSDCSHLISIFRRYMGLTPYQYQKETRNREKRGE